MYKIRSLFCALLALTLLAGCGFHLRQSATVPSALQPIYLGGKAGFGALAQQLRIMLTRDEMALSATAARILAWAAGCSPLIAARKNFPATKSW